MKKGLGIWAMAGLAATVVFSTGPARGAEVEVGKVVVTATKTEMEIGESPQSISVITKDEIQNSPDRTIGEILQRAPRFWSIKMARWAAWRCLRCGAPAPARY